MSEDKALTIVNNAPVATYSDAIALGEVLYKSGFFTDLRSAAQATVKVLAGRELGYGPIASITGLYVQNGHIGLMANLIAAQVKNSDRYNYKIIKLTNTECELAFYENGEELQPRSTFTMSDAQTAGLTSGKNAHSWKNYPRNMLFARAVSNGVRWHCPELFNGPAVYTPEELEMPVDDEGNVVVDVTPTVTIKQELHWSMKKDKDGLLIGDRFFDWVIEKGLTIDEALSALKVELLTDFEQGMAEAKGAIEKYIDDCMDAAPMTATQAIEEITP